MNDRTESSRVRVSGSGLSRWGRTEIVLVALVNLTLFCMPSYGGSIFMKNGYIIQGRIVDRDTDGVILGWPNGKVAIAHRFVESVVYEPGEEERILLLENTRKEKAEGMEEVEDIELLTTGPDPDSDSDLGELPASLETLMRKLAIGPGSVTSDYGGLDPFADLADVASSSTTVVGGLANDPTVKVETAELALGPAVGGRGFGMTIRPPETWADRSGEDFLAFVDASLSEGFRPNFNIVSMRRGPLSADDLIEVLKVEQNERFLGFELLSEGPILIADRSGYELVGRVSEVEVDVILRQIVLVSGEQAWLFSVFTGDHDKPGTDTDRVMAQIDLSLDSVRLVDAADYSGIEEKLDTSVDPSDSDELDSFDTSDNVDSKVGGLDVNPSVDDLRSDGSLDLEFDSDLEFESGSADVDKGLHADLDLELDFDVESEVNEKADPGESLADDA